MIGFIYLILSLCNLGILRQSRTEVLADFMITRGLTAVILSFVMYRIMDCKFKFTIRKHTKQRITFGGVGMALQILSATSIPISLYALLNRATPIWFSIFSSTSKSLDTRKMNVPFAFALIGIASIIPFIIQPFSKHLFLGVSAAMIGTLFIALSQLAQVEGANLDSKWLMPFPPSFGLVVIGIAIMLSKPEFAFHISSIGILSGFAMTFAYWVVHLLLQNGRTGGIQMVMYDLGASTILGVGEAFGQRSYYPVIYIMLSLFTATLLSPHLGIKSKLRWQSRKPPFRILKPNGIVVISTYPNSEKKVSPN